MGAFDASNSGYGVAYRESAPENVLLEFSSNRERHGNWHFFSVDEDAYPLLHVDISVDISVIGFVSEVEV